MATGSVQVTAGSGTYIASNTISEDAVTKNIQRTVINSSAGTELATSSNPLQVSLANTAANATAVKVDNSAVSQPVVYNISTISATITRPADTNAYAAGDTFADSTSSPTTGGFTFTSAARSSGGTGVITDAVISSSAKTNYSGEIWIFDQAATAKNDNAAFDVSTSDVQNLVGVIPFQTSDTNSTTAISYVTGLNIPFTCVGTANLRFLVKLMAAVTPASAEVLAVRIKVTN